MKIQRGLFIDNINFIFCTRGGIEKKMSSAAVKIAAFIINGNDGWEILYKSLGVERVSHG